LGSLFIILLMTSNCGSLMPFKAKGQRDPVGYVTPDGTANAENSEDLSEPVVVSNDIDNSGMPEEVAAPPEPVEGDDEEKPEEKKHDNLTEQELIDSALEYYQASNEFWEQGDQDNAIYALDKANSLILKVNGANNPEVQQQKDDLRYTISKRIVEVYDQSRSTAVNGTHKEIPLVMNKYVQKAIDLFTGKQKKWFLEAYARSGRYRPSIVKALKEAGLPEQLSWLPLIESGFRTKVRSRARAWGMWQFIASTGYRYGLKRDNWVDERMDPEKSTRAAIAYLTYLHELFGEWTTVLAAYNCGEKRIERYIKSQEFEYLDRFWDIYEKLPRETAFYVPKFFAVLHILNDPKAYNLELPLLEEELEYEDVTISKQVELKSIAKKLGVADKVISDLNSELRHNVTPKTAYNLKVPKGHGEVLLAKINDIPVYRPPVPAYVIHRVRFGESLSVIAEKYGTSMRSIMNMNGLRNKHKIIAGQRLKIPTGKYSPSTSYPAGDGTGTMEYIVKRGDSLWKIANQYNTTVKSIKTINSLTSTRLKIGQRLQISTNITGAKPGGTLHYTVKKGDSPYLIAKRYRMNLYDFLKLNNLTPKSTIFPGQIVQVVAR
jgi:membrane-bound lytic murein transglycosylase D